MNEDFGETLVDHEVNNEMSNQQVEEEHTEEVDESENEGQNEQDENKSDQEEEQEDDNTSDNHGSKVESENDNESDEEFAGFDDDEIKVTKKRQISSDDSADENLKENDEDDQPKRIKKTIDSDDEENNEQVEDNDEEDNHEAVEEEEEEVQDNDQTEEGVNEQSDEEDFDRPVSKVRSDKVSDVDLMLAKNKAQKAKNRRKNKTDSEEINDWDNKISMIISEMKNVAAEDRAANEKSMMSLQKHKMLPTVINMLQKTDFHATMIELGVLGAIAEWLAPLPDRSLPNINIREFMIETLRDFGEINADYLKSSGIGKAVMFLYKHSKETKENKKKLEKLINDWSRPIFSLDGNFKQLSREERLERDLEHVKMMNKREKEQARQMDDLLDVTVNRKSKKKRTAENNTSEEPKKFLRPGDVGFCPRARVPIPSTKDYIIRPKSNIEAAEAEAAGAKNKGGKKIESRMDKHKKRFEELRRHSKSNRAVTMVATGGK